MEAHTKKIMQARTALALDQPFFGVLALRLRIVADTGCKTAWVDGQSLGYNPSYIEGLSHAQTVALIAHEVMHCACGHPWRRDNRDKKKWNGACDYAINPIIRDAGFTLPEGVLLDPMFEGKSAEWIYARAPQDGDGEGQEPGAPSAGGDDSESSDGAQGGDDQNDEEPEQDDESENDEGEDEQSEGGANEGQDQGEDPGDPQGEVRDAPAGAAEDGASEGDWNAAVQQAANQAAAMGKLPQVLKRFADEAAKTKVDWRSALRRFVQEVSSADYSWTRPNRRYMSQGLYMPALHSEDMGPIVIAVDTSGSIDDVLISQFSAEVRSIIDESNPARVHVVYCDAKVHRTDTFERDELCDLDKLDPVGGGGTAFGPVFDSLADLDEDPACLIYLTDLMGSFPAETPEVPTLWATTYEREVPFGEVLPIDA